MAASQGSSVGTMPTSKTPNTRASSLASETVRGGRLSRTPLRHGDFGYLLTLFIQSTFTATVSGMVMWVIHASPADQAHDPLGCP